MPELAPSPYDRGLIVDENRRRQHAARKGAQTGQAHEGLDSLLDELQGSAGNRATSCLLQQNKPAHAGAKHLHLEMEEDITLSDGASTEEILVEEDVDITIDAGADSSPHRAAQHSQTHGPGTQPRSNGAGPGRGVTDRGIAIGAVGHINAYAVPLAERPGAASAGLTLAGGETVKVLPNPGNARQSGWLHMLVQDGAAAGKEGWVRHRDVSPGKALRQDEHVNEEGTGLHLRTGAGTQHGLVPGSPKGGLPQDTELTVLEQRKDEQGSMWDQVTVPSLQLAGWVAHTTYNGSTYVNATGPVAPIDPTSQQLTPLQIAEVARGAGFKGEGLVVAVAVALAESSGIANRVGYNKDKYRSIDRGLWQINSYWHKEYSDAQCFNAEECARAAYAISSGGSNWSPWTTYTTGVYSGYMPQARQGVAQLQGSGGEQPSSTNDSVPLRAMNYALSLRGKSYYFDCAGPDAWDCSGVVAWAYKQAGFSSFAGHPLFFPKEGLAKPKYYNGQPQDWDAGPQGIANAFGNARRLSDLSQAKPGDLLFGYLPMARRPSAEQESLGSRQGGYYHIGICCGSGVAVAGIDSKRGVAECSISEAWGFTEGIDMSSIGF